MCPVCFKIVAAGERDLLSHVLARHPAELAILSVLLSAANIALVGRPTWLARVDLSVLILAIVVARWPGSTR